MKSLLAGLLGLCLLLTPALAQAPQVVASAQVTVAATATLVAGVRPTRGTLVITNLGATDTFCGPIGVTTSTGALLLGVKGSTLLMSTTAAVYCIVAAATQAVTVLETY